MVRIRVSRRQKDLPEDLVEEKMVSSRVRRRQYYPPEDLVEVKMVNTIVEEGYLKIWWR